MRSSVRRRRAPSSTPTPATPAVGTGDAVRVVTAGGVRVLVVSDGSAPLVAVQAAWAERADALETPLDEAAPADRGAARRRDAHAFARGGGGRGTGHRRRAQGIRGPRARSGCAPISCRAPGAGPGAGGGLRGASGLRRARGRRGRAWIAGASARRRAPHRRSVRGPRCGCSARRSGPMSGAGPRPTALPAMGRCALLDHYRRRYPLSRLIVAVVGNVDPAAVAAALRLPSPHRTPPRRRSRAPSRLPSARSARRGEGER